MIVGAVGAALMVRLKSFSEYRALEPVTRARKLYVLAVVGVPLITPVLLLRLNPAGKLPDTTDQLYGVVPPVACRVWL